MTDEPTCDALLRGRIRVWQPRRGHPARVLDLGCGVGVIAVALLVADPEASGVAVELQDELASLARRNAALNGLAGRLEIVTADLRRPLEVGTFDAVVSNPPFHAGGGRVAPDASRAVARHEVACTIADVADAARRHVAPKGRCFVIYPAERTPELLAAFADASLTPRTMRFVHSVAGEAARRVLVEAAPGWRGGVTVSPPLVVHADDRKTFTEEAAAILGG